MKNQDRHVASVQCHGRGDSLNLKITIKFPPDPSLSQARSGLLRVRWSQSDPP